MNFTVILIIIFTILFFVIFFDYLFNEDSRIIKYRITKEPVPDLEDYIRIQNSFKKNKCEDVCKKEFCSEYHSQRIKYDLCKECKKEFKCYDPYKGICVPCFNFNSCESLYGCGDQPPIPPLKNFCTRCWNK
jgi:hypothetical protein